ncbi:hypothetical protein GCM10023322_28740 [Rugosimonospora acidiphila]|uniref:ChrR-like cupin domain-containing protein n=1 Tax=Rugosimonospora acidiphila TaxID=556531 RepID=A0ABP9RS72_9ACTN
MSFQFRVASTDRSLSVPVRRVLVAGFTGRDSSGVQAHIDELRELGVPVPDRVPILMPLPAELLTTGDGIEVGGDFTSGEVEAVIVVQEGRRWLTVGSDHTDRELERHSISGSKAACPKIVADTVIPLDGVPDLDAIELASWADGEPYQRGTLAEILPFAEIEELLHREGILLTDGDVLFTGSLPVTGGPLRPAQTFRAALRDPATGAEAELRYQVRRASRPSLAKPELEFTPVDAVEWTPTHPPVSGQTERILARYGDTSIATRMLRFLPGTDTSALGPLTHDFWEEVYILSGSLHDLRLGQTFEAGTYACRPPGMPHGPWVAPEGCVTFEVRYPAVG